MKNQDMVRTFTILVAAVAVSCVSAAPIKKTTAQKTTAVAAPAAATSTAAVDAAAATGEDAALDAALSLIVANPTATGAIDDSISAAAAAASSAAAAAQATRVAADPNEGFIDPDVEGAITAFEVEEDLENDAGETTAAEQTDDDLTAFQASALFGETGVVAATATPTTPVPTNAADAGINASAAAAFQSAVASQEAAIATGTPGESFVDPEQEGQEAFLETKEDLEQEDGLDDEAEQTEEELTELNQSFGGGSGR
ncbi:hypothetical protein MSAN_01090300 [Mycena sanguinolenta]|uniref:Uncharacterized protein n=1 Tax=Mycena sanguinolenta TaxID=230812 RepID=A0A8H7D9X9_9AGAR|nr:hypothetical protein MSAN_01090300 [Mycena sanguinolenta]